MERQHISTVSSGKRRRWTCGHEQVQATTSFIETDNGGQEKEGETNGQLEKHHRRRDAGEYLERNMLNGPIPGSLEVTCWFPMLCPESRGLSHINKISIFLGAVGILQSMFGMLHILGLGF